MLDNKAPTGYTIIMPGDYRTERDEDKSVEVLMDLALSGYFDHKDVAGSYIEYKIIEAAHYRTVEATRGGQTKICVRKSVKRAEIYVEVFQYVESLPKEHMGVKIHQEQVPVTVFGNLPVAKDSIEVLSGAAKYIKLGNSKGKFRKRGWGATQRKKIILTGGI